jgi:hypothetical protein
MEVKDRNFIILHINRIDSNATSSMSEYFSKIVVVTRLRFNSHQNSCSLIFTFNNAQNLCCISKSKIEIKLYMPNVSDTNVN